MLTDSLPIPTSTADSPTPSRGYRLAPYWAAVLAAIFTWPLLFLGGLVTTYRVGMAVPDWPTTFGMNMFLYNMLDAAWGVQIEHGHRLYGAAVGVCTILLMLDFLFFDRRRTVKILGIIALLGVIAQGLLGGLRVNRNSTELAMLHGCLGQAFFGYLVALATITARSWFVERRAVTDFDGLRILGMTTLAAIYLQVVLGAWLRHFGTPTALAAHATLSLAVFGMVLNTALATGRRRAELPGLIGSIRAMEVALTMQILLGITAWWMLRPFDGSPHVVSTAQALVRTGHQANAALLLGAAVVFVVRLSGGAAGVPLLPTGRREAVA